MNRACFPKEKTPEFTKMGEIHELFVLALSLVWFAGANPESNQNKPHVRIFSARNSRAGNGRTNFKDSMFWFFLLENPYRAYAYKIPRFRGGGCICVK